MAPYQELVAIFCSEDYQALYGQAKSTNTCIRCGCRAELFRDPSARLEYSVSALCQDCQDLFFPHKKMNG
jgi:hypothetical protein